MVKRGKNTGEAKNMENASKKGKKKNKEKKKRPS